MVSTRCCCLCGKKSSTTFHLFPKDPTGLSLWKQVCNFKVYDDVSRLMVCSNHFTPDDYLEPNAKQLGGKLRLKRDRIPSVSVPNKIDNPQQLSTALKPKHEENVPLLEAIKPGTSSSISVPSKPLRKQSKGGKATTVIVHPVKPRVTLSISVENEFDESQDSTASKSKDEENEDVSVVKVIQPRTRSSLVSVLNKLNKGRSVTASKPTVKENHDLKDGKISEEQSSTVPVTDQHKRKNVPDDAQPHTPKRRFYEPRYFGDVTFSDVSTPKKAKKAIMLAKEQIKRQNSRNRALQQKNRRLQKKIDGLQILVRQLKQKKV